ncbi:MAG: arginine deiminase-related protein [Comamonadaceae bacterium]
MVRPHAFRSNPDTLVDNAFQKIAAESANASIASTAYAEVSTMVEQLRSAGVVVHLFEDRSTETPDSVFPNNWFSTHAGGHIAIYPMASPSRQHERRWDVIDALKHHYRVQDVIDYSGLEQDHIYLEGTGAMVLDHIDRVAYVARSNRSDPLALERFCTHFNYEPLLFNAADASGRAIYHTNVLMCIGTDFAIACLDMVSEAQRRNEVRQRLMESGRSLIELTQWQVGEFCGNALELEGSNGRLLALSSRALRALTPAQTAALESSVTLLPLDVPTIELAGGSVRCMLAGVHLKPRRSLAGVS